MNLALAISSARPIETFASIDDLAARLASNFPDKGELYLARGVCTARNNRGELAIAVYPGHPIDAQSMGFVLGLGHDRDILTCALIRAIAELHHLRPPGTTLQ